MKSRATLRYVFTAPMLYKVLHTLITWFTLCSKFMVRTLYLSKLATKLLQLQIATHRVTAFDVAAENYVSPPEPSTIYYAIISVGC